MTETACQPKTAAYVESAAPLTQEQAVPVIYLDQVTHLYHNRLIGLDNILAGNPYRTLYEICHSGNGKTQYYYVEKYLEYSAHGGEYNQQAHTEQYCMQYMGVAAQALIPCPHVLERYVERGNEQQCKYGREGQTANDRQCKRRTYGTGILIVTHSHGDKRDNGGDGGYEDRS